MGAQESSRRVTVDNSNDDTIGVVKISESLLQGDQERPAKTKENLSQEDVKKLWQDLLEKKNELDLQQENLDNLLQDAFEQGKNSSSPSFVDENLRKTLEEKQQELDEIRQKTKFYQEEQLKKSANSEKEVLKEFDNSFNEVQAKYSNRKVLPFCSSLRNQIEDCYAENKNTSLNCSQLVRDYAKCVTDARKAMLQTANTAS